MLVNFNPGERVCLVELCDEYEQARAAFDADAMKALSKEIAELMYDRNDWEIRHNMTMYWVTIVDGQPKLGIKSIPKKTADLSDSENYHRQIGDTHGNPTKEMLL